MSDKSFETFESKFRQWHDNVCKCRNLSQDSKKKYHYDQKNNYHRDCFDLLDNNYRVMMNYGFCGSSSKHIEELFEINDVNDKLPLKYGIGGIKNKVLFQQEYQRTTYYAFINSDHLYWFVGSFDPWGNNLKRIKISELPKELLVNYDQE